MDTERLATTRARRAGGGAVAVGRAGAGAIALHKRTSNLFRDRRNDGKRRLDLGGLHHVIAADAQAGWVDVEGMTTYEDLVAWTAAARLHAGGGAPAQDHHRRRRGGGRRHRGHVVPPRPGARHPARDRGAAARRRDRGLLARQRASRPVLRLSQFLRHPRLCAAAARWARSRHCPWCASSTAPAATPRRFSSRWLRNAAATPISSTAWCSARASTS